MKKLTAFDLYERRGNAGYQKAPESLPIDGVEVYICSDVDARIAEMERACVRRVEEIERELAMSNDAAAKGEKARTEAAGMQERIEELEQALRWCSTEGAYWNDQHSFFCAGGYEVDAPDDVRKTISELMER